MAVGGILYQGLLVHADGRFVADLEQGGGVVRAVAVAVRHPARGYGGLPATTVGVPVPSLAPPATEPPPVDAVPIPLLRGLEPELEVLPEAMFGARVRGIRGRRPHPGRTGLGRRSGAGDRPLRGGPWWCSATMRVSWSAAWAGCRCRSTAAGWRWPLPVRPA